MEFERREDDRWHVGVADCPRGGSALTTLEATPDESFARDDGDDESLALDDDDDERIRLRLPDVDDPQWCEACRRTVGDRYARASDAIEHWQVTTGRHIIEWSEATTAVDRCDWCRSDVDEPVYDRETATSVCEVCATLFNSRVTDVEPGRAVSEYVRLPDEVEPIVVLDGTGDQRVAAKIDRRPYVSMESRRKYVSVSLSLTSVAYRFSEPVLDDLEELFETYEGRAFVQPDNNGGVDFEVGQDRSTRRGMPGERVTVDGLFEEDAREFIEEVIPLVRTTSGWTYDPEDAPSGPARRTIREHGRPGPPPVPRAGAPSVEVQDDGIARHAPLGDKSVSDGQIRAYVSSQAYRHGKALVEAGRIRANPASGHEGDASGYDVESDLSVDLWFENGEIVDHECPCWSSLDPCEHVAAALLMLPRVRSCYV